MEMRLERAARLAARGSGGAGSGAIVEGCAAAGRRW